VDENLYVNQQCVLATQKGNCILGCIKSSMASRSREWMLPSTLLCSGRPHLESCVQALEPPARERHVAVGVGPEEGTKMVRGLENLFYEERLFSLERRKLQGDLMAAFQ